MEGPLAWLRFGIQLEATSISFYKSCLESADSHYLRSLFDFLILEETGHLETLRGILAESSKVHRENINESIEFIRSLGSPPMFSESDLAEMKDVDLGLAGKLNKAVELEEKAASYYAMAKEKEADVGARLLLSALIDQERQHKRVILTAGAKLI
jgi:rubrerythrin